MATLTKRVQVLLPEEQWKELTDIAAREKHSVGQLIREAVQQIYFARPAPNDKAERLRLVEEMVAMNLPVDDWEVMEEESMTRSYFDETEE